MVLAWIVNGCLLAFVAAACINLLRRRRSAKRRTGELVISPLSGLAMGAMQLGLQAIVQPQAQHMIVEEQKEESDASGMEPPGGRLFHEQLRRIRHGDEVEEVVVRLTNGESREVGADQTEISAAG
jgi:hypothetical protein